MLQLPLLHAPSAVLVTLAAFSAGTGTDDAPLRADAARSPRVAAAPELEADATGAQVRPTEPIDQGRLESLAREIQRDIERMRGQRFQRPVVVSLASREDFQRYARRRIERNTSTEELAASEVAAKLLGLIPPDMDLVGTVHEVLEEQVSGFYDPELETFWLLEGYDADAARVILAHELTHALDDQLYDYEGKLALLNDNDDARTALQAVIEGSAIASMLEWLKDHPSAIEAVGDLPGIETDAMLMAPQHVWMPFLCVYFRGPAFLMRSSNVMSAYDGSPARQDLRRAFLTPPSSTEQILHPSKYWDPEELDAPLRIDIRASELPEGWRVGHRNSMGELGMALLTTPPDERNGIDLSDPMEPLRVRYTRRAALGWSGDSYVLLESGAGRLLVSISRWDDAEDSLEFYEAVEEVRPHIMESTLQSCIEVAPPGSSPGCLAGAFISRDEDSNICMLVSWYGVAEEEADRVIRSLRWSRVGAGVQAMELEGD